MDRTVIISDITEDLPIEKLIKLFQKTENLENFDVYDYDKIQLTFWTKERKLFYQILLSKLIY